MTHRPALVLTALTLTLAPLTAALMADDGEASLSAPNAKGQPLGPVEGVSRYSVTHLALPTEMSDAFEISFAHEGETTSIEFSAFSLRATGFSMLLEHGDGVLVESEASAPKTFRGTETFGDLGAVTASLLDDGLYATVNRPGGFGLIIQPASSLGLDADAGTHVIFDVVDTTGLDGICGNDLYDLPVPPQKDEHDGEGAQGSVAGGSTYLVEFAAETDYEFFQKNGSSTTNTINDVELVVNQMDYIYDRDVDITLELTTIVIHTSSSDPYSAGDIEGRLNQFIANWNNSPETEIHRDVAQMFSGVNFSGGVIGLAPLGVLCYSSYSYSIVESRYTTNLLYRTSLSAHELGHNWNSGHCDGSSGCAIMCSSNGGCGTPSSFGPSATSAIVNFRNSVGCDMLLADPLPIPFEDTFASSTLSTTNWIHNNGGYSSTSAVGEPSPSRSLNLDASSGNEFGDDEVRSNLIQLGGQSEAYLSYWLQHRGVESGEELIVYYPNTSGDWIELARHTSDGENQSSFSYHLHTLPSAARHNSFRIRFQAAVNESNDDWYIDDVRVSDSPSGNIENDDCGVADVVLYEGLNDFSTVGATNSNINDPLTCSTTNGPSVESDAWFTYTSTCTGMLTIEACDLVDFDCRLSIYDASGGCPSSGNNPLACNDNGCGTAPSVSVPTLEGYSYHIRLGSSDGSEGEGQLRVTCDPFGDPPVNDACEDAIAISEGSTSFTTLLASAAGPHAPLNCSTSNGQDVYNDVWFTYSPSCTGIVTVSACDATIDTRLLVYLGATCPGDATNPMACADDTCGLGASVSFAGFANYPMLIRVGSPVDEEGNVTLVISCDGGKEPCEGDLNNDGNVDGADIGLMLASWGGGGDADLNGDGTVDGADIGLMLAAWGPC
jgi:hypothetical protein